MPAKKGEPTRQRKNRIFISWSGANSKEIAIKLKYVFENIIFPKTGLVCFVSDIDIASGTDWWNKIKGEISACRLGIVCITKENVKAPWIYFESGAMVARSVPTIPLLINCSISSLDGTPLKDKQCVDFYNQEKFIKMIADINAQISLTQITRSQLDVISRSGYEMLKNDLAPVLKQLKNMRTINEKYIYPNNVTTVKINTVYISAPMASIDDNGYNNLRTYLLTLKDVLKAIGFTSVICPIFDKKTRSTFDGQTKAIKDNFIQLKQVDSMLIVYPQKLPSSILVELGYGIALCKRLVIFYREGLPFILESAGETIRHVKTFKFNDFAEITEILSSNGMAIFEGDNDE